MKKTLILFIANIVFIIISAKILPLFINTNEKNIERALMIYFLISMIYFLIKVRKDNA